MSDIFSYTLAATSCTIPDTLAANCRYLAQQNLVHEVALCFFETKSCLAYTEKDLPPELIELPFSWHVHLPLDLPWHRGPAHVAGVCQRLMQKAAYLCPAGYVLHPPESAQMLYSFSHALQSLGQSTSHILLENIKGNNLIHLFDTAKEFSLGFCLDLGHILAYGQELLLQKISFEQVNMLHVSAALQQSSRHLSLAHLDSSGKAVLRKLLWQCSADVTVTFEIFEESGLKESVRLFQLWAEEWGFK